MSQPYGMVAALRALYRGDRTEAFRIASGPENAGSRLGPALATFLGTDQSGSVYGEPAAFEAFISGGGNITLYRDASAALADLYARRGVASLLDIGTGDGRALAPSLVRAARRPDQIDVVEPSPLLLVAARTLLSHEFGEMPGLRTWPMTAQEFVSALDADADAGPAKAQPADGPWDLAQSTFALHTMPTAERTDVLARLRAHVRFIAIVEFDVPDLEPGSDEHLTFLATTYEQGLAEYGADAYLVAQGFLMPVLVGQLAPNGTRVTYEQPAAAWKRQLEAAGYGSVATTELTPYWSSPAFLLTAEAGR